MSFRVAGKQILLLLDTAGKAVSPGFQSAVTSYSQFFPNYLNTFPETISQNSKHKTENGFDVSSKLHKSLAK